MPRKYVRWNAHRASHLRSLLNVVPANPRTYDLRKGWQRELEAIEHNQAAQAA